MWHFQGKLLTKLKRSDSDTQTLTGPKIWSPYIFYTKSKEHIFKIVEINKILNKHLDFNKIKTYITC